MFSVELQSILNKNKFELMDQENNIWVKEVENKSITISGEDNSIEVIFEDFENNKLEEQNFNKINLIFEWMKKFSIHFLN